MVKGEVGGMKMRSIDGKVVFRRGTGKCACCEGGHVYEKTIQIEPYSHPTASGLEVRCVNDFINEVLETSEDIEGKKVKVTVEFSY